MALLRGPASHLGPQRAPWVPTSQPPPSDRPHFLQRVELGLAKTRWCVGEARGDRAKCQELQTENLLASRGAWPEQSLSERGQGSSFVVTWGSSFLKEAECQEKSQNVWLFLSQSEEQ